MSDPLVIRIHPADDVVIARHQLVGGTVLASEGVTVMGLVPPGHKLSVRAIAAGQPVRRYNQIIGTAKQPIAPGQHVHTHNLEFSSFARAYAACTGTHPTAFVDTPATFLGLRRADGRIATRNYIGVLTSVNCSATVARAIADHFRRDVHPEALANYPNVDGVIALTHGAGCATDSGGEPLQVLRRTLGGYARHANFASILVVGLGCETNQISGLMAQEGLKESNQAGTQFHAFNIQETGGTKKTVAHGIDLVQWLLEEANQVTREPVSAADNNPSAGNKAGGLTTILEKSLGAIAKSGTTNLTDVFEYAQAVTTKGLVFMDTPGYDPVSATGQVAGGANLICFTTGRGSAYGCAPSPSLKLSTNTALWLKQEDDIDINCGEVIDGSASIDAMGERIFRMMLRTASGEKTKSEVHGYGQNEFVPWALGAVM